MEIRLIPELIISTCFNVRPCNRNPVCLVWPRNRMQCRCWCVLSIFESVSMSMEHNVISNCSVSITIGIDKRPSAESGERSTISLAFLVVIFDLSICRCAFVHCVRVCACADGAFVRGHVSVFFFPTLKY